MKRIAALMTFYARRPGVMRQHLGHAARVLSTRGWRRLADDMRWISARLAEERALRRIADAAAIPAIDRLPAPRSTGGTVLIVVHDMALGGAQQVARSFGRWLKGEGSFAVRFIALRDGPFRRLFEAVAPVFCVEDHPEAEAAARLRAWAGPDVQALFVNSVASGGIFRLWAEDTPAIGFVHELPRLLDRHGESLALMQARAHRLIGGSRAVCAALASRGVAAPAQVYPFVEDAEAQAATDPGGRAAARAALGIRPGQVLVAGCGVLHWRKAPDLFVETAAAALARNPALRFVWIGGGPDLAEMRALVRSRGLTGRVTITGYRPDAMDLLRGADLFLLPSEEDAFPLVALQAALAGAPVICFDGAGGTPELVARGCGLAVPRRDTAAMAKAVLAYAADPARRLAEGQAGRRIVAEGFTVSQVGPALLGHLRAVIAARSALTGRRAV